MEETNKKEKSGFKIFILILLFAIAIFLGKGYLDKLLISKDNKTLQIAHKIPATNDTVVKFYENVFIKYDNNTIVGINKDGTIRWKKEVTFDKPIVYLGDKVIYLSQGTTGDIYFLDQDGNSTKHIQLDTLIDEVIEKDENIFVLGKENELDSLTVLNKEGNSLCKILIPGTILNFKIGKENKNILISNLNIGEDNIISKLNIYNINGDILGDMVFTDEIITFIDYIDGENVIISTDKCLYCIKGREIIWENDYTEISDIYIDKEEKNIYLLVEGALKLISYDGEEKTIDLSGNYNSIYPYHNSILVIGDEEVIGFDKEVEYLRYKLEESGKVLVDNSNIIQITDDKINVMKVVKKTEIGDYNELD